jgi:hypothetical protein
MDDAEFLVMVRTNPSAAQAVALWGIAKNLESLNEKMNLEQVIEGIANLTEVIERFQFPIPVLPEEKKRTGIFGKK